DVVGARAVDVISTGNVSLVSRREQQEFSTFAAVRTKEPDVAKVLAAIDRDGALPVVEQNALKLGRRIHHQRPILAEVNVTHCVEEVGVGSGDERLGAEALFPDGQ